MADRPRRWTLNNQGAVYLTGGRHTLALVADPEDNVEESDETDNYWEGQWVWSPLVTARAAPVVRLAPPFWGYGTFPNCDGSAFTRDTSYAWVTAVAPQSTSDDYDLYLYDDYSGSMAGYSNLRGYCAYGGPLTDFVVGHYAATPTTVYPAVVRYNAGPGANYVLDQDYAIGRNSQGTGNYPAPCVIQVTTR